MATNFIKLTIEMPKKEYQKLKVLADALGLTKEDLVLDCLRSNVLYNKNQPNTKTLKAIQNADTGKNLKIFKNANELFKDLGLDN